MRPGTLQLGLPDAPPFPDLNVNWGSDSDETEGLAEVEADEAENEAEGVAEQEADEAEEETLGSEDTWGTLDSMYDTDVSSTDGMELAQG